jgi:peptide/nickel transport system ATP-binding protein
VALLELKDLTIEYRTPAGAARAVDGISVAIEEGEYLGLVGESGCGKSTIAKAILGILPPNGSVVGGQILYRGRDLTRLNLAELNRVRWREIALVPQSAMNGFDPVYTIEQQIGEAIEAHMDWSQAQREARIGELFDLVGMERSRLKDYPHQFSGGMRQRAMIAMAMVLDPSLVVADEPTTGLDVIVQDQILHRIKEIHSRLKKAMLLITHDMAVVAENCDKIAVMYAGRIVEYGAEDVFERPFHPYTMGLCRFAERCPFATDLCRRVEPLLTEVGPAHVAACHHVARVDEFRLRARQIETWAVGPAVA